MFCRNAARMPRVTDGASIRTRCRHLYENYVYVVHRRSVGNIVTQAQSKGQVRVHCTDHDEYTRCMRRVTHN